MPNSNEIAVIGGGKIGALVLAHLQTAYPIVLYDQDPERSPATEFAKAPTQQLDVNDAPALRSALTGKTLVVNCCPHFCNVAIATAAREADISYIDLSEDVASGDRIEQLAAGASGYFVPRCGIAPGFIQIVAAHIMSEYESIESVQLRVGALPENPTNALKYNLTWSTDGLINEYGNPCEAIVEGELKKLEPLEGYERIMADGVEYEAFNTSGGLGTLAHTALGKVDNLNYKTMRYLGHRDLMKFLLFDLKLNEYRAILKRILESAVPTTDQDKVVVLVTVVGTRKGMLAQHTYTKTFHHGDRYGSHWTAIQLTTASSAAAVAELIMTKELPHTGHVRQEEIDFDTFCSTQFGKLFRN